MKIKTYLILYDQNLPVQSKPIILSAYYYVSNCKYCFRQSTANTLILLSGLDELYVDKAKSKSANITRWNNIETAKVVILEEMDKLPIDSPIKVVFESRKPASALPNAFIKKVGVGRTIDLKMTKQV